MMMRNRRAFTIIELVVSLVIIGVICSCMVAVFSSSNRAQTKTNNNLLLLNEISNLYTVFSSDQDLLTFVEGEYANCYDIASGQVIIYYDKLIKPTSIKTESKFRIRLTITQVTDLETIHAEIFYPDSQTSHVLVTDRTVRRGGVA